MALCSLTWVACSCGFGQALAQGPFQDKPASARSLPADDLPPFGMLGDHVSGAAGHPIGRQDEVCAAAGLRGIK